MIEIVNEKGQTIQVEEESKKGFNIPGIAVVSVTAAAIIGGLLWKKLGKKETENFDSVYDDELGEEIEGDDLFEDEEAKETE